MSQIADRSRVIDFDRARNFRDLGGYPSRFGGATRWGMVYRAAALHEMTDADLERFEALGVVKVYDLRSDKEYADHPDPVPAVHVPLLGRFMANNEHPDFATMIGHDHGFEFMRNMLLNVLHWGAPEIGTIVAGLAAPGQLPAVFHCSIGKDRTGVLAALLLEALGVDRELVLDDFHLSEAHQPVRDESYAYRQMTAMGMPPEAAAGALGASREMLASVLAELDAEYGGIEPYLVREASVDPTAIGRLRALLLA